MMKNGDQKLLKRKRSVFRVLVFGMIILSLVIIPVSAAKLATPVLISPANNQHFYHSNPVVFFSWKPVLNAEAYFIECEYKLGSDWIDLDQREIADTCLRGTPLIGSAYRWRVTARASGYTESNPSGWRTFDFKMNAFQLATPVLVSPATGTNFYQIGGNREMVLAWKPVPGADQYTVDFEYYDTMVKTWIQVCPPHTNTGSQNTAWDTTFNGPYKGRWRVWATDTTGGWQSSKPSAWWTFTHQL